MKKIIVLLSSLYVFSAITTVHSQDDIEIQEIEQQIEQKEKELNELRNQLKQLVEEENIDVDNNENVVLIEHDDFIINITDVWIEEGTYTDGEVIVFQYDFTNERDEPIGVDTDWMFLFSAIQDNNENTINRLSLTTPKDFGFEEYAEVKPGGTMTFGQAYELDDDFTPVTLSASEFAGDEFWSHVFEITDLEKR